MRPTKDLLGRLAAAEHATHKDTNFNLEKLSMEDVAMLDIFFFGLRGQPADVAKARFEEFLQRRPDISKALTEAPLGAAEARQRREARIREHVAVSEFRTGYRLRCSEGLPTEWQFK